MALVCPEVVCPLPLTTRTYSFANANCAAIRAATILRGEKRQTNLLKYYSERRSLNEWMLCIFLRNKIKKNTEIIKPIAEIQRC